MDNIYFQFSSQQTKTVFVYMYKKMKTFNELDSALVKLAEYTFEILNMEYFRKGLEGNRDDALVTVWNELPVSVRNLYSANSVYLKEAMNSEYLYAASDGFTDGNRRHIFTWIPREEVSQAVWFVEHDFLSKDFYFVNEEHFNEYMYASEDGMGEGKRYKYVFTWKPQGRVDSGKSAWNLKTVGPYLQIRNVFNNHYLCVTSDTYSTSRRYVFALSKDLHVTEKYCLWILEKYE